MNKNAHDERKIYRVPVPRMPLRTAFGRVLAVSATAIAITFAALSVQMALGSDPALGPKAAAGEATTSTPATDSGSATQSDKPARSPEGDGAESESDSTGLVVSPQGYVITPPAAPVRVAPQQRAPAPAPVQTKTS